MLRVPLILMWKDQIFESNKIEDTVSLVDLFPTILDLCNIDNINQIRGKSLLTLVNEDSVSDSNRSIMFETYRPNAQFNLRGMRLNDHKYIVNTDHVTKEEFQQFEQGIRELLRNFLEFFLSYGLELGKHTTEKEIDRLGQKLQALGFSIKSE